MKRLIKLFGWLVVLAALLTLIMSMAVATPVQVAPAAHVNSPALPFILWDTRPDHMEAYYNPQTHPVQSPYDPAKYGAVAFELSNVGFGATTGVIGKLYVFNPRADGTVSFGWAYNPGAPFVKIGDYKKGVDAVFNFDVFYTDYNIDHNAKPDDFWPIYATGATDIRVEVTGVHTTATPTAGPTDTPVPTDTPIPPTSTPMPPTATPLANGCLLHPNEHYIICLTQAP